jgi:hypothetical protein
MNLETTMNYLFLGAVLGAVGQGFRVVVGLKKQMEAARILKAQGNGVATSKSNEKWEGWFDGKQLSISIMISLIVGAVAGIIGVFDLMGKEISREALISIVALGYAGTDFIEGFVKSKGPVTLDSGHRKEIGTGKDQKV